MANNEISSDIYKPLKMFSTVILQAKKVVSEHHSIFSDEKCVFGFIFIGLMFSVSPLNFHVANVSQVIAGAPK